MKRLATLIMIFTACLWSASTISSPTDAEAKRLVWKSKSGDAKLKVGFRAQIRLRSLGEAEVVEGEDGDEVAGKDYDFDFRRLRIAVGGQINKLVKFSAQTDLGSKLGQDVLWRDAFITLNFSEVAKLSFGLFKVQFARSTNGSGYGQMNLDRAFVVGDATDTSDVDGKIGGKRDQQLVLWGNAGKINYKIGVGDGAATKGLETDTLRYSGRVHYAVFDAEKKLGYKETYLGKKKILTIGLGVDSQASVHSSKETGGVTDNSATTLDINYQNAGVYVESAYFSRDLGDNTSSSQGSGFYLTAGMMFGDFMPYARYASWDADPEGKDKTITNLGFNYLIKGHNAKIVFDIEMIAFEEEGSTLAKKDHTIATMQWQLDI